jgi:cholesterol oxidase
MRENPIPSRLSSHVIEIEPSYEVVVVGSGYGGSIAACRLARAGRQVCVLERGREFRKGDFPEDTLSIVEELQQDFFGPRLGSKLALFDIYANDPVNVVVGCGLGGTSLINANVSIKPDARVFSNGHWPKALAEDVKGLCAGYRSAQGMLAPTRLPANVKPAKLLNHEHSARAVESRAKIEATFERVRLNVKFEKGTNGAGFTQPACVHCGNCASGCNYGAKGTLVTNYLPDARAHGAEIFTHAEVSHVERVGDRWAVHFTTVQEGGATLPGRDTQFVLADVVVLAAGTLGSTGILLRSARRGLPLSKMLGQRFSGNGDQLAFAYGPKEPSNAFGWAKKAEPTDPTKNPVGPTITSAIRLRGGDLKNDVLIEEGAIPVSIARVAADGLAVLGEGNFLRALFGGRNSWATQVYLIMSMDDAGGTLKLDENERVRVAWKEGGKQWDLKLGKRWAKIAAEGIDGKYLDDPIWKADLGHRLVSVHPLGGCPMGDDATTGVVDDACRVFSGTEGTAPHPGLYVCDGAVIPSALGVNPLFTISAVAERAVAKLAASRKDLPGGRTPGSPVPDLEELKRPGLEFDEQMKGWFSPGAADFDAGLEAGRASGTTMDVRLVIRTEDLAETIDSPAHELRIAGVALAPSLSPTPLTITHGLLNLFYEVDGRRDLRLMRYRMRLTSPTGKSWWFDGYKHVGRDQPLEEWHDSTTLYVTLREGEDTTAPVWARGRMRIDFPGALRLALSVRPIRAKGLGALRTVERFVAFGVGVELGTAIASYPLWSRGEAPSPLVPPDPPAAAPRG